MKALVLTAYGEFQVKDLPRPVIGPSDALVRVMTCGICGSDVHGMDGSTGRRRPPIVMGHEAAGVIEEIGSAVSGFGVGDRVTFDSTIYNPDSYFSRRGLSNLCDNRRVLGVSCEEYRQDGAFAEFVKVPSQILYHLPAGMTFEQAALAEPVSVALHALSLTRVERGDSVVVWGAGLIGLMITQVLKKTEPRQIIVVDIDETRLSLARELGARHVLNSRLQEAVPAVKDLTLGRGADVAFEAVGVEATVRASILGVRKGGAATLVGMVAADVLMPLQAIVTRQIRLQGCCASSGEYPESLELIASGMVKVDPFVSATAPLEDGAAWFQRLYRREGGLMKVLLKPNA